METKNNQINSEWIDIATIKRDILPKVGKKSIRKLVRENLDFVIIGNRTYIEKNQLLSYLRKDY